MELKYFFCPASGSLNKHNETGSIGQISYEFLKALSTKKPKLQIDAVVFDSFAVTDFANVKIHYQNLTHKLDGITSLKFYLWSFIKYFHHPIFKAANIVHHFMPFSPGITFNFFFIFKNPHKKYIIGPLLGTHTNTQLFKTDDHKSSYSFVNILSRISPLIFGWLNQITMRNADILLFSDSYAKQCYSKYIQPHHQVFQLNVGIDQTIFKPKPKKTHSALRILFVGRLSERKGCIYLLQALSQLDIPYQCDIFGSGPQDGYLRQMSDKLNVHRHVIFHGRFKEDKDVVPYYQSADIVVCPALSDTWVTAKQALSCGTPVIITNIASHPEIVHDNVNGFLVPIQDSTTISQKLKLLANDPNLRRKLSVNAVKLAAKHYNWENIISTYVKITQS